MKLYLTIVFIGLLILSCQVHPRYRKGGEEGPAPVTIVGQKYTTNHFIRLGIIMHRYLGRPYKGRSKFEDGVDCSHFTSQVYKEYDKLLVVPRTVEDQYKYGKEIHFNHLRFGDLLFFRTERGEVSHVGIYVGYDSFMHASSSKGVIISSLKDKYWAERYAGARRVLI